MNLAFLLPFLLLGNSSQPILDAPDAPSKYFESQLSPSSLRFYAALKQMDEGRLFQTCNEEFDLLSSKVLSSTDLEGFAKGDRSLLRDFGAAKEAYFLDHPGIHRVDSDALSLSFGMQGNQYVASIGSGREEDYLLDGVALEESDIAKEYSDLNAVLEEFASASKDQTPSQIAVSASDFISSKASYSFCEEEALEPHAPYIRSAYGALVRGYAVCEGYAKAYALLMERAGIPCLLVNGYLLSDSGNYEPHMWNDVEIDGKHYAVDPTTNDSLPLDCLLEGSRNAFLERKEDGEFGASGQKFAYPILSASDYGETPIVAEVSYPQEGEETALSAKVSYRGKNAEELQSEGIYLAVSYSSQTSKYPDISWSAFSSLPRLASTMPEVVKNEEGHTSFRDWGSAPHLRFAAFDQSPNNEAFGTYSPEQTPILLGDIIENEAYDGHVSAPRAISVSPSNQAVLDIRSRYHVELRYGETLVRENPLEPIGLRVSSSSGIPSSAYVVQDVRFDELTNTLSFDFRPSPQYAHDGESYGFAPTNLVGEESEKAPMSTAFTFAYDSIVCSKLRPGNQLYIDAVASPTLIADEDLSLEGWKAGEQTLSKVNRTQLALVATSIGPNDSLSMVQYSGVNEFLFSRTYELSLHVCGLPPTIPEGSYVKLNLGFPEGMNKDTALGTSFTLYHFKRYSTGDIDPSSATPIPCVVTPLGIVAEIPSFSPFALIQTSTPSPVHRTFARVVSGKGSALSGTSSIASASPEESIVFTLSPEEGQEVDFALYHGKLLEVKNNQIEIPSEDYAEGEEVQVGFVSTKKKAQESSQGIEDLTSRSLLSSWEEIQVEEFPWMVLLTIPLLLIALILMTALLVDAWKRSRAKKAKS